MMDVYVGENVLTIPFSRWYKFREFLFSNVNDVNKYKYLFNMMYGYVYSVDVLDEAIEQIDMFLVEYKQFKGILLPLKQLMENAKSSNKEVGFGVL